MIPCGNCCARRGGVDLVNVCLSYGPIPDGRCYDALGRSHGGDRGHRWVGLVASGHYRDGSANTNVDAHTNSHVDEYSDLDANIYGD